MQHYLVPWPGIFVQINRILTKFLPLKVRGSGNYDTPWPDSVTLGGAYDGGTTGHVIVAVGGILAAAAA